MIVWAILTELGRDEDALRYYERALALASTDKDRRALAAELRALGHAEERVPEGRT